MQMIVRFCREKMMLQSVRLPILLAAGIFSVGGIYLYTQFRKRRKKCLLWRRTPIYTCSTAEDWMKNEKHFLHALCKSKVIGLDCEWVKCKGKRLPVSLLQIATSDVCVVLRMTSLMNKSVLPPSLINLLEDSSIVKVGVGVAEDVQKLFQDYGICVNGFCDLRFITDSIPEFKNEETKSLKDMAWNVAGIEISKSNHLRCSNWEAEVLSAEQIIYAAGDAIVSSCIFDCLIIRISPERWIKRLFQASSKEGDAFSWISECINIPYSSTRRLSPSKVVTQPKFVPRKINEKEYGSCRQKPLYDNCLLVAPDGEHLCICNYKKIRWYAEKGLGEIICEDPLTLRLKFEPAERPILDKEYYLYEKDNCCVVCGSTDRLLKKNVVPIEYRRYFPEIMKSHLSHDILLLCASCHQRSNTCDYLLRNQLVKECNAPLMVVSNTKMKETRELRGLKSAARALNLDEEIREKIPAHRLEELEKTVKDFFNVTEVTNDILIKASNMQTMIEDRGYVPHGEKVVEYMCHLGSLFAFESRWRQNFLDTMKPQYLPKLWSVTHSHEWIAYKVAEGNTDFDPAILGLSQEQLESAVHKKYHNGDTRSSSISA